MRKAKEKIQKIIIPEDKKQHFNNVLINSGLLIFIFILLILQLYVWDISTDGLEEEANILERGYWQLNMDWTNNFIEEIVVKDEHEHCSQLGFGYGPLFSYDWPGIQEFYIDRQYLDGYKNGPSLLDKKYGAYCNASLSETIRKDVTDSRGEIEEVSYEGDEGGDAFPMIQISSFKGKQICAKFSKLNYNNIEMANEDGECPDGFKTCEVNYLKDKQNYICIPKDVNVDNCPIRDMHLMDKDEADRANFTYVEFDDEYKIGYSILADELPLSQFTVQHSQPCRDRAFQSMASNDDNDSYLNELVLNDEDSSHGCPLGKDQEFHSEKFRKFFVGSNTPQISVYETEQELYQDEFDPFNLFDVSSDINLIGYCEDISQAVKYKKETMLKFWIAPFDKFDKTCSDGKDTSSTEAIEHLREQSENLHELGDTAAMHFFIIIRILHVLVLIVAGAMCPLPKLKKFCLATFLFPIFCIISFAYLLAESFLKVNPLSDFDEYYKDCLYPMEEASIFFGQKAETYSFHAYAAEQIVWQVFFEVAIFVLAIIGILRVVKVIRANSKDQNDENKNDIENEGSGIGEVPNVEADQYGAKGEEDEAKEKKTEADINTSRNLVDKDDKGAARKSTKSNSGVVVEDVEVELEKRNSKKQINEDKEDQNQKSDLDHETKQEEEKDEQ